MSTHWKMNGWNLQITHFRKEKDLPNLQGNYVPAVNHSGVYGFVIPLGDEQFLEQQHVLHCTICSGRRSHVQVRMAQCLEKKLVVESWENRGISKAGVFLIGGFWWRWRLQIFNKMIWHDMEESGTNF